jgi:hypothetical protein
MAMLMAEIERTEHGDSGRARAWTLRAVRALHDPVWTADGYVSDRWRPVSPVTGRLDAFQWRVPVADLAPRGPIIVQAAPARHLVQSPPQPLTPAAIEVSAEPAPVSSSPATAPQTAAPSAPEPTLKTASEPEPLKVHAPDDPGPEPEAAGEPVPKPSEGAAVAWHLWFSRGEPEWKFQIRLEKECRLRESFRMEHGKTTPVRTTGGHELIIDQDELRWDAGVPYFIGDHLYGEPSSWLFYHSQYLGSWASFKGSETRFRLLLAAISGTSTPCGSMTPE